MNFESGGGNAKSFFLVFDEEQEDGRKREGLSDGNCASGDVEN